MSALVAKAPSLSTVANDGSVTVVQPPVMVELDPNYRQEVYANCINALEEMIQDLSAF